MIKTDWTRRVSVLVSALAVALLSFLVAGAPASAAPTGSTATPPPPPQSDAFYQPPAGWDSTAPGTVLRSRIATAAAFNYLPLNVRAWQVLYRTTDTQDNPEATAALVLVPDGAAPMGERSLVAYQVAEDSLGTACGPTYQLQAGVPGNNYPEEAEILLMAGLLGQGDGVVVSDYEGPNPAYAAGIQAGHAVLDSVRATEGFAPAGLAGPATPVAMWGYSGGALATMWAAELQPTYAPELNVKGVAAGGIPVNVGDIARKINGGPFAGYYLAGLVGVSRAYPQLASVLPTYLTAEGQAAVAQVGTMCNSTIVSTFAFRNITSYFNVADPLSLPAAQQVLADDTLGQHTPTAPMYLYQAVNDELIPSVDVDGLVNGYCQSGGRVAYDRDLVSEHISLVATGGPAALSWLTARLDGVPAPPGCTVTTTPSTLLSPAGVGGLPILLTGLIGLFL